MGRFARAFKRGFEDVGLTLTSGNWSEITGSKSIAGVQVTEKAALRLSAVYACVKVLSETMASLPLFIYQRKGNSKQRAPDHQLYELLHNQPNPEMTSFTWRETMMGHLTLWGNAYCEIEYDEMWKPKALWPLRPDRTWPERDKNTGEIIYRSIMPNGQLAILQSWQVLHIPGFGFDGLIGYSPIRMMMDTIGLAMATQEYGSRFYSNGARPSGILEHPKTLSEGAQGRLRDSFDARYAGLGNMHRTMLLEEGMSYKQIGVPPEEAQFIESRKFSVAEIARIFRVPLHLIGDLAGATFSNIEHQSIEFVTMTITPYCIRFEQEYRRKLLTAKEKIKYFIEHLVEGLMRGDLKSRYDAYAVGRNGGWLSSNDIREKENMNPIEGGDEYYTPVNMMPSKMVADFWTGKKVKGGGEANAKTTNTE